MALPPSAFYIFFRNDWFSHNAYIGHILCDLLLNSIKCRQRCIALRGTGVLARGCWVIMEGTRFLCEVCHISVFLLVLLTFYIWPHLLLYYGIVHSLERNQLYVCS